MTSRRRFVQAAGGGLLLAGLVNLARAVSAPTRRETRAILLVAATKLRDPNFGETVVLVTRHGRDAPLGVILNRPLGRRLETDLDLATDDERLELNFGGPVMPQQLLFLYQDGTSPGNGVLDLGDNLFLSSDAPLLKRLLQRKPVLRRLRLFAGYAGWAPGQLAHEISRGDWLLAEAGPDIAFTRDTGTLWRTMIEKASRRAI